MLGIIITTAGVTLLKYTSGPGTSLLPFNGFPWPSVKKARAFQQATHRLCAFPRLILPEPALQNSDVQSMGTPASPSPAGAMLCNVLAPVLLWLLTLKFKNSIPLELSLSSSLTTFRALDCCMGTLATLDPR